MGRKLKVKVTPGVDSSSQIRITAEGEAGPRGGPHGNLYIAIDVKPHEFFVREGNDILMELPLNVAQAALGAEVAVPTVDSEETIRVPPGTQTGATFRLRGKGAPLLRANGRGDQIVIVRVAVPTKLTEEQRRLFDELSRTFGSKHPGQERDAGFIGRIRGALGL